MRQQRFPVLTVLLSTLLFHSVSQAATSGLRHDESEGEQRMPVLRRLYGPETARRHIAMIEERMPRYRTGLGDPDHIVPYENHPYDKTRRQLQSNETDDTAATLSTDSIFEPIRIQFFTYALEEIRNSTNSAKIDWVISEVLPRATKFWSEALSVVPVSGNLQISSSELEGGLYCGDTAFTAVPEDHISTGVSGADLLLYVSASNDPRFCPERTLAVAVPCNFDQFDRPTAGAVNVCLGNIILNSDGTASKAIVQDYIDVSIHEMGHVLGHSGTLLSVANTCKLASFAFASFAGTRCRYLDKR